MGTLNTIFSLGLIGLQIFALLIFVSLFFKKSNLSVFVKKYFLQVGFSVSFLALAVSITYSTLFGFEPCVLCWWARIFMFPQVIIFGVAFLKKKNVTLESLLLSLVGIIITGYHTYIDFAGGGTFVPCGDAGLCLKRYVFEFGYITIPVMALTGFVFLTLLCINQLKNK
jgi:hypothetical protein